MGEVVPARTSATPTSPIPSHCASIVVTSTVRVKSISVISRSNGVLNLCEDKEAVLKEAFAAVKVGLILWALGVFQNVSWTTQKKKQRSIRVYHERVWVFFCLFQDGGEFYLCDMYADQDLPASVRTNKALWGKTPWHKLKDIQIWGTFVLALYFKVNAHACIGNFWARYTCTCVDNMTNSSPGPEQVKKWK